MCRSAFLFAFFIAFMLAHTTISNAEIETDREKNSIAFEQLLPDQAFFHGMQLAELDGKLESDFADWVRTDIYRAMNNRSDVDLPQSAKEEYLQRIFISEENKDLGIRRTYKFALTSPLSGSRVYSIVYGVEAIGNRTSLISRSDWANGIRSKWGSRYGGNWTEERARSAYFFGADKRILKDAMRRCKLAYTLAYRLDEKTVEEVSEALEYLSLNDCAYSKDTTVTIEGNDISKTIFFDVELQRSAADVLKRVAYGLD